MMMLVLMLDVRVRLLRRYDAQMDMPERPACSLAARSKTWTYVAAMLTLICLLMLGIVCILCH